MGNVLTYTRQKFLVISSFKVTSLFYYMPTHVICQVC
uniref:Uncharacterized protein n=1 Tax=Arundo donax TaxID=35708 RepID=A0A0A8YGX3_ARUDO